MKLKPNYVFVIGFLVIALYLGVPAILYETLGVHSSLEFIGLSIAWIVALTVAGWRVLINLMGRGRL